MDRNSLIGLLLIGATLIGWLYWMSPSEEQRAKMQKQQDSLLAIQKVEAIKAKADSISKTTVADSLTISQTTTDTAVTLSDSALQVIKQKNYGAFANAADGQNNTITIENELIKVNIETRGARISSVELKNYKTHLGLPLVLFDADSSKQSLLFIAGTKAFSTDSFFFQPLGTSFSVHENDSASIALRLFAGNPNKYIEYVYSLKGNSYNVKYNINFVGMNDVIATNTGYMTLNWAMKIPSQEKSIPNQQAASTVYFKYTKDDVDYITETSDETQSLSNKIKWIAFKQQFFASVLIADTEFDPSSISSNHIRYPSAYIKNFTSDIVIPYNTGNEKVGMKFYFGPTQYNILKKQGESLEGLVPLGWGIFGWVNKFIVIPIFKWLGNLNLNYGIIILILTIIIKLILFPIAYKTYLSSAKMRVLKPEIDEIDKKLGKDADPLKKQQAKMQLYKRAGINPMAGCVPLLLQMPILIALFKFFPASIELRQQAFLWAEDLSTYDSILDLSFNIPFYGDHVSLFTLLMTVSTILYTYSNSQLMSGNEQMPGMKIVMYLMPIMFLGIFNSYSAGLSYYYFLANMITFGQTFIMRRFVDEDELHRKIQENKKKPVKVSSFQQKLEKMAKEQQQRAKQRGK